MFQKRPVRRSKFIAPWGVGAIVNFPYNESLMVCGLDAWEEVYKNAPDGFGEFRIHEERLQKRLKVEEFRLPPDYRENRQDVSNPKLKVPFIRFPRWHYCPQCGIMKKLSIYSDWPQKCDGTKGYSCYSLKYKKRPNLIPSRFITICRNGHINDFPFKEWVHKDQDYNDDCILRYRGGGTSGSLSGISIECVTCGMKRTLKRIFHKNALKNIGISCRGLRPWLGEHEEGGEDCGENLRVVLKGSSNVYFPKVYSSIYLPKWNSSIKRNIINLLDDNWHLIYENGEIDNHTIKYLSKKYKQDEEELLKLVNERKDYNINDKDSIGKVNEEQAFRRNEYRIIINEKGGDNQDFSAVAKSSNLFEKTVNKYFNKIVLIHKLRETRVFAGFSRLLPEDGKSLLDRKKHLFKNKKADWLPAIIIRGEGVFFEFDSDLIDNWLKTPGVSKRFKILSRNYNRVRRERDLKQRPLNPRFILLHTFAHIIINRFSYVCGYGSSSLRERIYCDCYPEVPENHMNGVLIYTASGDSEGSMGGLVRQGSPGYLENIVESSIEKARWCSSDPVCINSKGQGPDSCNLAACHNCALLPETSCEEGNRLLDRGLLIGIPEEPEIGFFNK